MVQLDPKEKKIAKGIAAVAVIGVGAYLLHSWNQSRKQPKEEPAAAAGAGAAAGGTAPPPKPEKPKADVSKEWAPDAILSYGSKRKKMVEQIQILLNAIGKLRGEAPIKVDGDWGKNTEARAKKYLGKSQTSYNRLRPYVVKLYKDRGLEYPSGKPIGGASGYSILNNIINAGPNGSHLPGSNGGWQTPPPMNTPPGPGYYFQNPQEYDGYGWNFN